MFLASHHISYVTATARFRRFAFMSNACDRVQKVRSILKLVSITATMLEGQTGPTRLRLVLNCVVAQLRNSTCLAAAAGREAC